MIWSMEQNQESNNRLTHIWPIDFDISVRVTQWGKKMLFNKWWYSNCITIRKNKSLNCYSHAKTNSRWITDIKVKATIKLLNQTKPNLCNPDKGRYKQKINALNIKQKFIYWTLSYVQSAQQSRKPECKHKLEFCSVYISYRLCIQNLLKNSHNSKVCLWPLFTKKNIFKRSSLSNKVIFLPESLQND